MIHYIDLVDLHLQGLFFGDIVGFIYKEAELIWDSLAAK